MASGKKAVKIKKKSTLNGRLFNTIVCLSVIVLATVGYFQYQLYSADFDNQQDDSHAEAFNDDIEQAVKPFVGDQFPLDQIFSDGPRWGSLNSGHYFGLKLTTPDSIESSLLWFKNELNQHGGLNLRHLCDQNDNLKSYAWTRHDFYSFGEQFIQEDGYSIKTDFIVNPNNKLEWQSRVQVEQSHDNLAQVPLSMIQYITTNRHDDQLEIKSITRDLTKSDNDEVFVIKGHSKDTGDYELSIRFNSNKKNFIYANYLKGTIRKDRYPISSFLQNHMVAIRFNGTRLFVLPGTNKYKSDPDDDIHGDINIIAYQLVLSGSASFFISFRQVNSDIGFGSELDYEKSIKSKAKRFDEKFSKTFPLSKTLSSNDTVRDLADRLGRVSLSNMIGSIGYFYGSSYIGSSINEHKIAQYGPIQLLTGVPSRSFFPRGFLWDEAFHNILISEWDPNLSNLIIKSWFDIMNNNGWIPREIILGIESMRRVPREFIVQRIANANPPAMFIILERMLDRGTLHETTLESLYPRLKAWYNWFNITQSGPKLSTFRWRGRDELSVSMLNPKTLTSGLDDYPRASHPSPHEYHIDLRCWMALAARTMTKLASRRGDKAYELKVTQQADELANNRLLDELHWSAKHQMYCDYGYNTEKAELVRVTKTRPSRDGKQRERYEVLERRSTGNPNFGCVPEFGYVSLFPMLMKILDPQSEKLSIILDRLKKKEELWSPYGVRSLSRSSRYYNKYNTEHDKPYWRGAIWLNLNYLILTSLEYYSNIEGPYRERCSELFIELKENLVNNALKEFSRTNYIWENYDDQTGQGRGSHPFTGWSALILLIMSSNLS